MNVNDTEIEAKFCLRDLPALESRLQAGVHYVELADDYHDIDEKLDFYERHPDAAQTIIANANAYMQPFRDRRRETLCQLLVMQRYFSLSGQME